VIYAIAAVLVLILDQAVKFWTTKNIFLNAVGDDCVELIKSVVHLTNVHNYGAAFSILQNARWFLVGVTVLFVVGIIVLLNQEIIHTKLGKWSAVLLLAGALGNCIDRVLYGYVVDMFELEFISFPVFNVADIFVTVFGILFIIHVIFHNEPEEVKKANEPEFVRRHRAEKEAKEAPYANIPKRGEHKSLADEMKAEDPDDPFGEWGFGDVVEDKPEPKPAAKPEEKKTKPAAHAQPKAVELDDFEFEVPLPQRRDSTPARKVQISEPEPEWDVDEPTAADEEETFSLEDILSEFGDL
jgi:signal peptidase II